MREPNVSEREAVRRYNWLVRKDKEVPVRAELAELVKQIEAWPAARTVERTIPQIHFATGIEPVKLPVGIRHIVANEATNLKNEVDAASITYAHWYQTRFVNRARLPPGSLLYQSRSGLEHRCNHRRVLAHQCAGRQTTGNYRRGYRGRSVSARTNDGPDKVCGWPSGSPNRHRDIW